MMFYKLNASKIYLLLFMMAAACSAVKDRDCDVPDSYHRHAADVASTKCEMELNDLADKLANISRCMLLAARPLSACLSCYSLRPDVERAYATIMGPGPGQSACAHELLDRDSTHMMVRAYTYYTDLLAVGRCDLCLQRGLNGSYQLLPAVTAFIETDNALRKCIQEDFPQHQAGNSSAVVCDFCRPQYDQEQIRAQAVIQNTDNWRTCRDVIDMANTTQYMWQHHGCDVWRLTLERFLYSLVPLLVGLVIVAAFYGYAWRRYVRLERATRGAAAPAAAGRAPRGQPRHLYDYSGLRRRPPVDPDSRDDGLSGADNRRRQNLS